MERQGAQKRSGRGRRRANYQPNWIFPAITGGLFILLIILLKTVDVDSVGAASTSIGLSTINVAFAKLTGVHTFWYKLTQIMGIFLLLVVAFFALLGAIEWKRRKKLWKVDWEILSLGGLYVVLASLYVFFEKVVVNYRPILMDGSTQAEASFPSSHTMLVCVVMGSAILLADHYFKSASVSRIIKIVCAVIIALTVFGRLICGVHWLTDILGGVLISLTLLGIYKNVARI